MKTWQDYENNPQYQALPDGEKNRVKKAFFDKKIATTPEYQKASHEGRQAMTASFMGVKAAPGYNFGNALGEGVQTGFDQTLTGALVNKGIGRGIDQQNPLISHAPVAASSGNPLVDMARQSWDDTVGTLQGAADNLRVNPTQGLLEGVTGGLAAGTAALADPIGLAIDAVTAGQGGKLANKAVGAIARAGAPGVAAKMVPVIPHALGAASGVVQGGAYAALQGDTQGVPANALIGGLLTGALGLHPRSPLASTVRPTTAAPVPPAAAPNPAAAAPQAPPAHDPNTVPQFGQAQANAYAQRAGAPAPSAPTTPIQPTTAATQRWTLDGKPVTMRGVRDGLLVVDDGVTRHTIQPGHPSLRPEGGFQTVNRPGAEATAEAVSRDGRERGQGTDRMGERPEGYQPTIDPVAPPAAPRAPRPTMAERYDNFLTNQATQGEWNIPQTPKALNAGPSTERLALPPAKDGHDLPKVQQALKNAQETLDHLEHSYRWLDVPDADGRVAELVRQQGEVVAGLKQRVEELSNPERHFKGDVLERGATVHGATDRALEGQHDPKRGWPKEQGGQRLLPPGEQPPERLALPPAPERGRADGNPTKQYNHGPIPQPGAVRDPGPALYGQHPHGGGRELPTPEAKPNRFAALDDPRAPRPKAESPAPSNAGPVEEAPSPSRFRQTRDGVAGPLRDGTPAPTVRQLGAGHPAIQPPAKPKASTPNGEHKIEPTKKTEAEAEDFIRQAVEAGVVKQATIDYARTHKGTARKVVDWLGLEYLMPKPEAAAAARPEHEKLREKAAAHRKAGEILRGRGEDDKAVEHERQARELEDDANDADPEHKSLPQQNRERRAAEEAAKTDERPPLGELVVRELRTGREEVIPTDNAGKPYPEKPQAPAASMTPVELNRKAAAHYRAKGDHAKAKQYDDLADSMERSNEPAPPREAPAPKPKPEPTPEPEEPIAYHGPKEPTLGQRENARRAKAHAEVEETLAKAEDRHARAVEAVTARAEKESWPDWQIDKGLKLAGLDLDRAKELARISRARINSNSQMEKAAKAAIKTIEAQMKALHETRGPEALDAAAKLDTKIQGKQAAAILRAAERLAGDHADIKSLVSAVRATYNTTKTADIRELLEAHGYTNARLKAGEGAPAAAPAKPESKWPEGVTRAEYIAWKQKMEKQGVTEDVNPGEYKRLRDAGLIAGAKPRPDDEPPTPPSDGQPAPKTPEADEIPIGQGEYVVEELKKGIPAPKGFDADGKIIPGTRLGKYALYGPDGAHLGTFASMDAARAATKLHKEGKPIPTPRGEHAEPAGTRRPHGEAGKIEQEGTTDGELGKHDPKSPDDVPTETRGNAGSDGAVGNVRGEDGGSREVDAGHPDREGDDVRGREGASDERDGSAPGRARRLADQADAKKKAAAVKKGRAANYSIPEDLELVAQGEGKKAKYKNNVAAIRLARELEASGRRATPDEQAVLAKFVGWGGIPEAFNKWAATNEKWDTEIAELRELLTPEEWARAHGSTTNAHFTAKPVIQAMYAGLERAGFHGGDVLEPGMGSGNFFGYMPRRMMLESNLMGIELDPLTAAIAKHLYPAARIEARGYETVNIPRGHFDLAISNVPFADVKPHDEHGFNKGNHRIHDFYFVKSLEAVRPGGVVAFVTASGTLDKLSTVARRDMAKLGDLVLAFRLPSDAFKKNAGTDVTTDVIIMRRREEGQAPGDMTWIETSPHQVDGQGFELNNYYHKNPEHMLGTVTLDKLQHQRRLALASDGRDLGDAIAEVMTKLPRGLFDRVHEGTEKVSLDDLAPDAGAVRPGTFHIKDGALLRAENGRLVKAKIAPADEPRVRGMVAVRGAVRDMIRAELTGLPDAELASTRAALNKAYDAFVKTHGPIHKPTNVKAFADDAELPLLLALEDYDPKTKTATKADMFTKRTVSPARKVESAGTAKEALVVSLAEKGKVDLARMAELTGRGEDDLVAELGDQVYRDPEGASWQEADAYLSGNVRQKLANARAAAELDAQYARNVKALEAVQPEDIPFQDVEARMGAPWIPTDDVRDFIAHMLDVRPQAVSVARASTNNLWAIDAPGHNANNREKWGTAGKTFLDLAHDALNMKETQVFDVGPNDTRVLNPKATDAANAMKDRIKEEFKTFLAADTARADRLNRIYNDNFNNTRLRAFDGSHLDFPGMNAAKKLRPHQANAVWRVLQEQRGLFAHAVGAGKTYAMQTAIMELKRMKLAKKPMVVVPNHLTEQFPREFRELYPGAKLLAVTKADFAKANRQKLFAKIATGDWDAVIIAHSQLKDIPNPKAIELEILNEEKAAIERAKLEAAEADGGRAGNKIVKELANALARVEAKMKKLNDTPRTSLVDFDQLGVDFLVVDEAHNFKNLFFTSKMSRVKGLGNPEGSKKAFDMYAKVRHIQKMKSGRGILMATGTPITNSMAEMYTMMRYLTPDLLAERGLNSFDAWAAAFGDTVSGLELDQRGTGFKSVTRFAKFHNIPELLQMFRSAADVQTAEMLKLPVPAVAGGKVTNVVAKPSPELVAYNESLYQRALKLKNAGKPQKGDDNMLKLTGLGRTASLSMRLIDSTMPDDPANKINLCVANVLEHYKAGTNQTFTEDGKAFQGNSAQLVFLDTRSPTGKKLKDAAKADAEREDLDVEDQADAGEELSFDDGDSVYSPYHDIKDKLVAAGIPENEIAFIHDIGNDPNGTKKLEMMAAVREGRIRVLLGSTPKMGEGTNVQRLLRAVHHLDATWTPAGMEQRNGRILRQGNLHDEVHIFNYSTERSFDANMFQLLATKQKFIDQVMKGDMTTRTADDLDSAGVMDAASMAAEITGNPLIRERAENEVKLNRLAAEAGDHQRRLTRARQDAARLPEHIKSWQEEAAAARRDAKKMEKNKPEEFELTVNGTRYTERDQATAAIDAAKKALKVEEKAVGKYAGFDLVLRQTKDHDGKPGVEALYRGELDYHTSSTAHLPGVISNTAERADRQIPSLEKDLKTAREIIDTPFKKAEQIAQLRERQNWIVGALADAAKAAEDLLTKEDGFLDIGGSLQAFADWVNARKKGALQNGTNPVNARPASPLTLTSEVSLAAKLPKIQRRLKKLEEFHAAAAAAGNRELLAVADAEIAKFRSLLDAEYQHAAASRTKAAAAAADLPTSDREYGGEKYAGNINLNRVRSSDDVKALLQDVADEYAPQIEHARRGKIDHAATEALADQVGMTAAKLLERKRGVAFNAEQVTAARKVLAASADNLKGLAEAVAAGKNTDDNLLEFTRAVELHAEIQAQVSGVAAEAGRALSAFNIEAKSEARRLAEVRGLLDSLGGRDGLGELARHMAALDQLQLNHAARKFRKLRLSDYLGELFVNSILSGPPTHIANFIGNTSSIAGKVLETHAAAVMGFGKGPVTHAEAMAQLAAVFEGARTGLGLAAHVLKTEQPKSGLSQVEMHRRAFKGKLGYGIRLSGTALQASDEFFKSIFYRMELTGQAHRQATKAGLKGRAHAERVAELLNDVPDELHAKAAAAADEYTFTNKLTDNDALSAVGAALTGAKMKAPVLTLFIPFIRTPLNIVHFSMKRTPMALLYKSVRDELRHGTPEQRQVTAGKIAMGSILGVALTALAESGMLTGSGDVDEDTKKLKMSGGWQPYSLKVGDEYFAYNRLGPMGILAGHAADLVESLKAGHGLAAEKYFGDFLKSAMNLTMNATYFRGVADLVKATSDPKRFAQNYGEGLMGAFVPNFVAKTVGFFDGDVRETEGVGEKLLSRIPGQSSKLPGKTDELGRPVKKDMGGLEQFLSPFNRRHDKHDPVVNELVDLGVQLKSRNTQIGMLGRDVDLPRELQAELGAIKGRALNLFLSRLVAAPGYQAIKSKDTRRQYIERAISDARQLGTQAFKAKYGRAVYGELVKQVRADRAQE